MSLKMEFVEKARAAGANVAAVCREFGISRETGHKWLRRFEAEGYEGLEERSRRPRGHPLATGEEVVMAVLQAREAHPSWGPKKLVDVLRRRLAEQTPSRATIARILSRFGRVRRQRHRAPMSVVDTAPAISARAANELWTVDFKGWWRSVDGARCEPLTVRDAHSRYILAARLLPALSIEAVRGEFERLFRRCGVPDAIQTDNGEPFVSVQSRGGLTRLSSWWASLGVRLVRSRLGAPQDNGAHERMHRDLKRDVAATPSANRLLQQRALDRWRQEFNHVRPHESLGGKTPADSYSPGTRRSLLAVPWKYPPGWVTRRVYGPHGCISVNGVEHHIGRALIGHTVGLPVSNEATLVRVYFRDIDLGTIQLAVSNTTIDFACSRFMKRRKRAT